MAADLRAARQASAAGGDAAGSTGVGEGSGGLLWDLALCVSAADFICMRNWRDLAFTYLPGTQYYAKAPAPLALLGNVLSMMAVLTGLCWAVLVFVRWCKKEWVTRLAVIGAWFVVAASLAWEAAPATSNAAPYLRYGVVAGFGAVCCLAVIGRRRTVVEFTKRALLLGGVLFCVEVCSALWSFLDTPASTYADQTAAARLPAPPGQTVRLLWLVFDEMDQQMTFELRPPSLKLPQLDRMRHESLYASNAHSPHAATLESMPALLTGRRVSRVQPAGAGRLLVTFEDDGRTISWGDVPNIFSRFRAAGLNSALIGWYHPYCRILGSQVAECAWYPAVDAVATLGKLACVEDGRLGLPSLAQRVGILARVFQQPIARQENSFLRRALGQEYLGMLARARAAVKDPGLSLILMHWMIPHPPGIFDRLHGELSDRAGVNTLDNLALVDRTIGELRQELEQAGLWDRTAVLITSDHELRRYRWQDDPSWTVEEERLTKRRDAFRVPFLLKLPGEHRGVDYGESFDTVLTHDLFLSVLDGAVSSPEAAAAWLEGRRKSTMAMEK